MRISLSYGTRAERIDECIEFPKLGRVEEERVMDCIECGSCSFTCPAHRPLLDYIRMGKAKVGAIIRSRNAK